MKKKITHYKIVCYDDFFFTTKNYLLPELNTGSL